MWDGRMCRLWQNITSYLLLAIVKNILAVIDKETVAQTCNAEKRSDKSACRKEITARMCVYVCIYVYMYIFSCDANQKLYSFLVRTEVKEAQRSLYTWEEDSNYRSGTENAGLHQTLRGTILDKYSCFRIASMPPPLPLSHLLVQVM